MVNAAKFAGVEEIDVYVEVTDEAVGVFVRDRGAGFDPAAVPPTARASPSRSRGGWSAPAAGRRSSRAPAKGPRSSSNLPRGQS